MDKPDLQALLHSEDGVTGNYLLKNFTREELAVYRWFRACGVMQYQPTMGRRDWGDLAAQNIGPADLDGRYRIKPYSA